MRKNLFFAFLIAVFVASCSQQTTEKLPEFPLTKGTTWVYSYMAYKPTASDPTQVVKATYQLTEEVVDVETVSTYSIAHVKREHELINADVGWIGDLSSQPNEFWYVVNYHQVFQSNQPLDDANIKIDELILAHDFPLSIQKSWCYIKLDSKKNLSQKGTDNCEWVGKREVTNTSAYQSPAGNFDNCYEIILYSNGGNLIHWFCEGVGVVSKKFDHAGTRFGFEQTLLSYSVGVP